jgi:hypothetical protein
MRSSRNAPDTFDWKSFHRRQKFSEVPIFLADKASLIVKNSGGLFVLDKMFAEMGVKGMPGLSEEAVYRSVEKIEKMSHFTS